MPCRALPSARHRGRHEAREALQPGGLICACSWDSETWDASRLALIFSHTLPLAVAALCHQRISGPPAWANAELMKDIFRVLHGVPFRTSTNYPC